MHLALVLAAALNLAQPQSEWQAIEPRLTFDYQACMGSGAARGSDEETLRCILEEGARQDRRLNAAYRRQLRRLAAPQRARLRSAQRAWMAARASGCAREARRAGGGTDAAMARAQCVLRRTVLRTIRIERRR